MSSVVKSCAITRAQRKKRKEKLACRFLALAILSIFGMILFSNEFLVLIALAFIVGALIIDKNTRRMF